MVGYRMYLILDTCKRLENGTRFKIGRTLNIPYTPIESILYATNILKYKICNKYIQSVNFVENLEKKY